MNKHTPGPWRLNENSNWKTNPFSITVSKPGVHSTTISNIPTRMTVPPQEQKANARLISAAPDLLEALKGASKAIREYRSQGATHAYWDNVEEQVNAAIKKAEGTE
jgi:hypothetical protein